MAVHMFGAIDVGSYEIGLKIYQISRGKGIKVIDHLERRIDLGSDTYNTGKLSYERVQQVGKILAEYAKIMNTYKVEDYKAYGTSAIREMNNKSLVLPQWESASGIHVDVISNSEQRFLDYKSVASRGSQFDDFIRDTCAIVDIGGGSIQISLFDENVLTATQNMPLGILRLYDSVSALDARSSQKEMLLEEIVDAQIQTFQKLYLGDRKIHNIIVVDDYISSFLQSRHTEYVDTKNVDKISQIARESSLNGLSRSLGMTTDALQLLFVSAVMLRVITREFGADTIWAPGVTLCDGIAYEYAEKKRILPPSHNFEEDILACASNISNRYHGSMARSRTLETIAVKIFEATKKIHGLGKRELLLLRIATTLHDCGKYISMADIGECGYQIIMSTEIIGLSHIEREIVANVVKFNHSDFIYFEEQQNASDLDEAAYQTIAKLTAILRIANGLDRSHKQKFGDIRVHIQGDRMILTVQAGIDITLEKGMISHRADFFEEVFGLTPVIKQAKN